MSSVSYVDFLVDIKTLMGAWLGIKCNNLFDVLGVLGVLGHFNYYKNGTAGHFDNIEKMGDELKKINYWKIIELIFLGIIDLIVVLECFVVRSWFQ